MIFNFLNIGSCLTSNDCPGKAIVQLTSQWTQNDLQMADAKSHRTSANELKIAEAVTCHYIMVRFTIDNCLSSFHPLIFLQSELLRK